VNVAPQIEDVTLDQQKFKQVIYNLLSNAIKFSHDGGKVEIRVAMHDAHHFKLTVGDTGIGIKSEDLQRLFNEFEQLDSGTSRRHEGTGLGLALSRRIVELQGATIGAESEFGKGSCFKVILPLVMAEAL
jgi:signal transduction histidine kinase